MKKLILLMVFMIAVSSLNAQTYEEWFRQKKTQKAYLVQQIAALEAYIGYAKDGYAIAQKGFTAISNFKNGELNLHTEYFNSLKRVNPKIKKASKVADIIAYQIKIVKSYKSAYRRIKDSNAFSSEEVSYINRVYGRLLEDCSKTIDELITVCLSNKLELEDGERLKRVDVLYLAMQDQYAFTQSFGNEALMLADYRIRENREIQNSRLLIGIKNE